MHLDTIEQTLNDNLEKISYSAIFTSGGVIISYESQLDSWTSFTSTITFIQDELVINPFNYLEFQDFKLSIVYMELIHYWVQYAEKRGIKKIVIGHLSEWKKKSQSSFFVEIAHTVGFVKNSSQGEYILETSKYVPFHTLIHDIESFGEDMIANSPYGKFEWKPWYSGYDEGQFFRFVGYLDSFLVNLCFYYNDGNCYFQDIKNNREVFFTPDTLSEELYNYFKNLLEEQKFKIMMNPPCRKLSHLISILPLMSHFSSFNSEEKLMRKLVSKGYKYAEVEEWMDQLIKSHESRFKEEYRQGGRASRYYPGQHDTGFGYFHEFNQVSFIKLPNHYIVFMYVINENMNSPYHIVDSKDEMIETLQNYIKEGINKLLP
ncbi:hypothetical protein U8V72_15070 [Priestia filamentosa]|uniref:hypothetical protein n=1 Tax=Priestia filamentosa TaxID=1402861 RepID=UPI00397E41AF